MFTRSRMKEWGEVKHHQSQYPRKEKAMKTFVQTRSTLLETLAQVRRLKGAGRVTQALRTVKERETGKLCYQAEEDLSPAELSLLRDMLQMQKRKWDTYKYTYCEGLRTLLEGNGEGA
jgi:hypothetical protein